MASTDTRQDDDPGPGPLSWRSIPWRVHAGPADSILLVHEVMSWQGRPPRIVARAALQLDPACDLLLNRLPNRFISPNPEQPDATSEAIADLAGRLADEDAFVIFPEGGNFTPARRQRAIERLSVAGHDVAAARAREMRNVCRRAPGASSPPSEPVPAPTPSSSLTPDSTPLRRSVTCGTASRSRRWCA